MPAGVSARLAGIALGGGRVDYRWRALFVGGLYFCFGAMERATWPNLLPTIGERFEVSSAVIAWTLIMFALGMAGSTLTAGRLGDLFGHRRLASAGFIAEALLLALAAISPILWPIFVFRFLQGFAAAAALNNVTAIVVGAFPPERRGRVIGFVSGLASIGLLLGPVYGGFLADWLDWRWAIGGIAAYTAVQALVTLTMIHPSESKAAQGRASLRSLNWSAAATFLTTMAAMIVAAQLLRAGDTRLIGVVLMLVAAGGVALTVALEKRAANPILNLSLFRSWNFSTGGTALIWFSLAFGAMNLLFPFYLQRGLGWTVAASGVLLIALSAVQPWGSPLSGWAADRLGAPKVMALGGATAVVSLFLAGSLGDDPTTWRMVVPLALFGAATSLFMPPATKMVYSEVDRTALASAAAMATSGRYIGQSIGAALGAALLVSRGDAGITDAFSTAMVVLGVLLALGIGGVLIARPAYRAIAGRRRLGVV